MQRETLISLVKGAFVLLGFAFLSVLVSGLRGPPEQGIALGSQDAQTFANLPLGATELRRLNGQRVWVTRLSDQQQRFLGEAHACAARTYCVILAATERPGVELVFVSERPLQLPTNVAWNGGFVNPSNGSVYDFGGRSILGEGTDLDVYE